MICCAVLIQLRSFVLGLTVCEVLSTSSSAGTQHAQYVCCKPTHFKALTQYLIHA